MQIALRLSGPRDRIAAELVGAATESPESEIRAGIADYITRRCDADQHVSVAVTVNIEGD